MSLSPTELTLREMRGREYFCWIVEHWNSFMHKRQDLWGIVDVLCLGENEVIGVQTTSRSNMSARIKKIADHESTPFIRKAGVRLLVHGWAKNKSNRWECKEVDVS